MSRRGQRIEARTTETFAGLADHVRLPSRFHARLSAISTRLRR
ncbi:hypothetical protein ACFSCV_12635 [Methylopila henanensis]|uniref:Uncharacterized protein n=1 Tax=Methylopila henanensis TaxID=873516 RepID=A0ABW4K6I5_9HYPH